MRLDDIPTVTRIEAESFSAGWPRTAYERELTLNPVARYLVLESVREGGVLGRLLHRQRGEILGFAGLWLMVDEAHVVTVAVAPAHRGHGYGRLLVHGLVGLARREGMAAATLECRVSNVAARALYGQYGFYEVGVRPRYYSDNREDAVIMTTEELASPAYQDRYARLERRLAEVLPGVVPRA
jgi:ribosomal-protein-alanine N-acetyltransferase